MRIENIEKEVQLSTTEQRYHSLVENLPIGIYRVTPENDGQINMVNSTLVNIFGYNNIDELRGNQISDFFVNPEEYYRFIDELISENKILEREFKLRKKNGEEFWCLVMSNADRNDNDKWHRPVSGWA